MMSLVKRQSSLLASVLLMSSLAAADFTDTFSNTAYNNQDGTDSFATDWQETGDDGSAIAGEILITGDRLRLSGRNNRIRRGLDLSDYTGAVLNFSIETQGWDNNRDRVRLYASTDNGSSWTTIADYRGTGVANGGQSINVSSYISPTTVFEFRTNNSGQMRSDDFFFVDDFSVVVSGLIVDNCTVASAEFLDCFNAQSYSNQDGTETWLADWQEVNDDGNNATGDVTASSKGLVIGGRNNGITRAADLSIYSTASLRFDYRELGFDNNRDRAYAQISTDGSSWVTLVEYRGVDVGAGSEVIDITDYISSSTFIRFITRNNNAMVAADQFIIDNISIDVTGGISTACDTGLFAFLDCFNTAAFDNNDGSEVWLTDWQEVNDNNAVDSGDVQIVNGRLRIGGQNNGIFRSADLSTYTAARLRFDYQEQGFDNNRDRVDVQVSTDGGANWTRIAFLRGSALNSGSVDIDISNYITSETIIRLLSFNNSQMTPADQLYIDNLSIDATGSAGGVCTPASFTFQDCFDAVSYANNDGTSTFLDGWQEVNDNNNVASGDVQITGDRLRIGGQNNGLYRRVDLSIYETARLRFDYQEQGFDNNRDRVDVQVSTNSGSNWTRLTFLRGSALNTGSVDLDLTPYITNDTWIRLISNNNSSMTTFDQLYIDNLSIETTGGVDPDACDPFVAYLDCFNSVGYSNQDGMGLWATDWAETNDDGSPSTGAISINNSRLQMHSRNMRLQRSVDLSGCTVANLSFNYSEQGFDNNADWLSIDVRSGGGWSRVGLLRGRNVNNGTFSVDISAFISANVDFRLRTSTRTAHTNQDIIYIDNFAVTGDCFPVPAAQWLMDELSWSGSSNDVIDGTGNGNDGEAFNGATTEGDTCYYGNFEGDAEKHYIEVPHDASLNGTDELTYMGWIRADSWNGTDQIIAKSVHGGGSGRAQMGLFSEGGVFKGRAETLGGRRDITAPLPVPLGDWTHVALVFDGTSLVLYIDGDEQSRATFSATTLRQTTDPINISNRVLSATEFNYYFDGKMSDLRVYTEALTRDDILFVISQFSNCPIIDQMDHFAISHDGAGLTCDPEEITITARDSSDNTVTGYDGTITIGTSTGNGSWSLLDGTDITTGSGQASYTFTGADQGQVTLRLANDVLEAVDINVTDGTFVERADVDPLLTFADAGFRFVVGGTPGDVGVQIAGKDSDQGFGASSIGIEAVRTASDGSCERFVTEDVTIELAAQCREPASCAGTDLLVNGAAVSTVDRTAALSYSSVSLNFGLDALAPLVLNYRDAGSVQLNARYTVPVSGDVIVGSTNEFVVRPFTFDFSVTGNPGGTAVAGNPFIAAGDSFDYTLTALQYDAADDSNDDGIADSGADLSNNLTTPNFVDDISITVDQISPSPGNTGSISPSSFDAADVSGGAVSTSDASYSEVGAIILKAEAQDYLNSGTNIEGLSPVIGRFYPAYFRLANPEEVSVGAGSIAVEDSCAVDNFTYMGQDSIAIRFAVIAYNSDDVVTQNYNEDSASGGTYSFAADFTPVAENNDDANNILSRMVIPLGTWKQGRFVNDTANEFYDVSTAVFNRATTPDGPFADLQLGIQVAPVTGSGTEDFSVGDKNMNAATTGDCTLAVNCDAIAVGESLNVRYGRLTIENAQGPQTADLPMPFFLQFYNSATGNFEINSSDSTCTVLNDSDMILSGATVNHLEATVGSGVTQASFADVIAPQIQFGFNGGDSGLSFSAPGSANTGAVDVTFNVVEDWLRFDWNNDGSTADNTTINGTVTFGNFEGHSRIIFWREQ